MGVQTSGQKQVGKLGKQAVGTLDAAEQDMNQNPAFLAGQNLATNWVQHALTYTPEVIADMKATAVGGATQAYQGAYQDSLEKAGAQGTYRNGAQRQDERRLAQGFGQQVGDINRTIDTQAALQRNTDYAQALDAMSSYLSQKYQFARDKSNAYLGVAGNPVWGQPSPLSSALGGVGQLAGTLLPRALFPGQYAPAQYGR